MATSKHVFITGQVCSAPMPLPIVVRQSSLRIMHVQDPTCICTHLNIDALESVRLFDCSNNAWLDWAC